MTKKSVTSQTSFDLVTPPPSIDVLTTASMVRGYQDYDFQLNFIQNDTAYVYTEYSKILTNSSNACDLYLSVNVTLNTVTYYLYNTTKTVVGNNSHVFWFTTDDSWPINEAYNINFYILDQISNRSSEQTKSFLLS